MNEAHSVTSQDGLVIAARSVAKTYRRGSLEVPVLRGLDLEIRRGEMVAVMGPSGSGKSTLLHVLGAMTRPTAGEIRIAGHDLGRMGPSELTRFRRDAVGFVFQRFNLVPSLSARDNLLLAARVKRVRLSHSEADRMLEWVGLADRARFRPRELSMGQQQRVAILRALVGEPAVILADEPTGNLDSTNSEEVMTLFERINRDRNQTVLIVTHNAEVAARTRRIYEIHDGLVTRHYKPGEP